MIIQVLLLQHDASTDATCYAIIFSICQIAVLDLLLHLGAVGEGSPNPAPEEEEPEEESQGLIEWSLDEVL